MTIRDKMRDSATPHLQPGETIQAVLGAQAVSPYWALITYWYVLVKNASRVVVATDKRILVCQSGRMSVTVCKTVLREVPRATRIGPAHGLWHKTDALGEMLWIHKRFHKDVAAADAAANVS